MEVEEFKKLMGIQPSQYEIFTMLKKRVLDRAVEEINEKTDIIVSYDLERQGRKVVAIVLKVKPKNENLLPHNTHEAIEEKLKGF